MLHLNIYLIFIIFLISSIIGYIVYTLYREKELYKKNYIAVKKEYLKVNEEKNSLNLELKELQSKLEEFEKIKEDAKNYIITQAKNEELQNALNKKEELLIAMQEELKNSFKEMANSILEQNQNRFLNISTNQVKMLLEPFNKELNSFKFKIEQLNNNQNESINLLRGEILQIKEINQTLSKEAKALANALKNDTKVQGNWGELILEKALNACGLKEGIEFKREQHFKTESGNLRADVVLYLPEDKHIVIDSKVSLNSYLKILKAKNEEEKKLAQKEHILSLKRHIDTLASKQYHKIDKINSPEFTLMFIPIEGAYLMALEIDSSIFEYAYERGVAVVTPTTLLTTLKTISTLWKLANHDKNMQKLAKEAASLHDKFALFIEDFKNIQMRLNQAIDAWESAKLKLISGQGNLHSKIKQIGKLSTKSKKELANLE